MFRGEKINITEKPGSPARGPARATRDHHVVDGENVVPRVHAVLDTMAEFSDRVRSGAWKATPAGASATSST